VGLSAEMTTAVGLVLIVLGIFMVYRSRCVIERAEQDAKQHTEAVLALKQAIVNSLTGTAKETEVASLRADLADVRREREAHEVEIVQRLAILEAALLGSNENGNPG